MSLGQSSDSPYEVLRRQKCDFYQKTVYGMLAKSVRDLIKNDLDMKILRCPKFLDSLKKNYLASQSSQLHSGLTDSDSAAFSFKDKILPGAPYSTEIIGALNNYVMTDHVAYELGDEDLVGFYHLAVSSDLTFLRKTLRAYLFKERFKSKFSSKDFQFNKKAGRKKRDSAGLGNSRHALLETIKLIQKWEVPDAALPAHLRSTFNPEKDQPDEEQASDAEIPESTFFEFLNFVSYGCEKPVVIVDSNNETQSYHLNYVLVTENFPHLFNLMKRDEEGKFRVDFTHAAFGALYRLITCFGVPFIFSAEISLGPTLEILSLGESLVNWPMARNQLIESLLSASEEDVNALASHFAKAVDDALLKSIITVVEFTNCRLQEKICAILKEKAEQIENIKRVVGKSNKDLLSQIETLKHELQTLKERINTT